MKHRSYLLLGSNRGNRQMMLQSACSLIEQQAGSIILSSSVYQTKPWGFNDDTYFLNQVVCIETLLEPTDLLSALLNIELFIGRTRNGKNYTSRLIDIDILFFNNYIIDQEHLAIPHPRLHERLFTLIPLAEIAGDLLHPVFFKTVAELLAECNDTLEVLPYAPGHVALKSV